MRQPASLFKLLHYGEDRRVGWLRLAIEPVAHLGDCRLAQVPDRLHHRLLQRPQRINRSAGHENRLPSRTRLKTLILRSIVRRSIVSRARRLSRAGAKGFVEKSGEDVAVRTGG